MKTITRSLLALCALLFLGMDARADHLTAKFLFAARLDGAQEVPPVATSAVGVTSFSLNARRDTFCITGAFNGLSGPITGAHIHEGPAGVAGPVRVDLMPYLKGNSLSGTVTGATLGQLDMAKLFSGQYYINIHTAANPSGEIRGQLLAEEDKGFMVKLDGGQETPAVVTAGRGLGSVILGKHQKRLSFYVVFDSLTGPITGAHFHRGPAGASGPVVQDLMPYVTGKVISGAVDPTSWLSQLLRDSIYINIHTAAHPGGEIRGQLRVMPYLHFDAKMNGAQEVPPVATSAAGLTVVQMNYAMDSLWYEVFAVGLSGPVTNGHLHRGGLGVTGPVILPFTGLTGNGASGISIGAALTDSFRRMLWEGNLYSNLHTAANPPGEIRGQVYRTFREGYTYSITGSQEVPPVSTPAYGAGMVSVDRDQTNAHYMAVVTGLTPTAAHFHGAPPGVNGPVIFDLGPTLVNNGAFGYWMDTSSANAFSPAFSNKFRKDSVYINYHTAANPAGEIRGNVSRLNCVAFPLGVATLGNVTARIRIYPNPVHRSATLEVSLTDKLEATVALTDIMGKAIWEKPVVLPVGTSSVQVPMEQLPAGLYFIRLLNSKGSVGYKVIKE